MADRCELLSAYMNSIPKNEPLGRDGEIAACKAIESARDGVVAAFSRSRAAVLEVASALNSVAAGKLRREVHIAWWNDKCERDESKVRRIASSAKRVRSCASKPDGAAKAIAESGLSDVGIKLVADSLRKLMGTSASARSEIERIE